MEMSLIFMSKLLKATFESANYLRMSRMRTQKAVALQHMGPTRMGSTTLSMFACGVHSTFESKGDGALLKRGKTNENDYGVVFSRSTQGMEC